MDHLDPEDVHSQTMSAAVTTPWIPPRPMSPILKVDPALPPEYMAWFVNRRAYTRQSDTPNQDNQRYYYYQPKERLTKKRLALDESTVRKHLNGVHTIGLYVINPETQRSKWVVIDADYTRAHRDLAALKLELKEDGPLLLTASSQEFTMVLFFPCTFGVELPLLLGESFVRRVKIEGLEFINAIPIEWETGLHRRAGEYSRAEMLRLP